MQLKIVFEDCSKKLGECDKEIILKREKLKLIQSSIAECLSELVSKEKRLAYVQRLQEKNLELWRKETEQFF